MERAAVPVLSKVGQVLVDELQDIRGVGNKVIQLRDELATMNAVLRVISEAKEGSVDHIVREWEKQVHDLVYDAEDCTDTYSLCISRPMARPSIYARAKRVARYPYKKLVLQRALAADIKDLLVRTTAVSERRARYNIDRATLPRAAFLAPVSAASISTNALRRVNDPDQFVGITEQADTLATKIKGPMHVQHDESTAPVHDEDGQINVEVHDEDGKSLKVLSIVGFGGLGKTTLAMELCRQLDMDFPCQATVSVSQAFNVEKDMEGLLKRLLQQLSNKKGDDKQTNPMDVEGPSSRIMKLLKETRYLILIDDVWRLPAWEAIWNIFPKNNCGSRIIVTTRIKAVAAASSVDFVHHMKPLLKESSEKLFVRRVFSSAKKGDCPKELQETMDIILKKCGGLPLAIVSIASLLPSSTSAESIDMWKQASRSISSHMESNRALEGMRQLITLSYDYLPHYLKACMMYVSIFPEDYMIAKDRLLYRWIAEGLVTEKRGLTLLEVAEEYFNELISRNMIQLDKFVYQLKHSREVEVQGCRVHDMILEVMVSKSHEYGFGKLLDHLGEFKLLRVLDLEDCQALRNKHMRDVCRLYLLKFLSLRNTNVAKMPRKVGNLEHLETLDVKHSHIWKLPRTVTKLSKLERLRSNRWNLPRGVWKMKALREVDVGVVDSPSVAQEIGKLTQLQLLSIVIHAEVDDGCLTNLASSLSKTSSLRLLNVKFGRSSCLEFLPIFSKPPPLLQCLGVFDRGISQLPDWISSLTHLTKIEVGEAKELDGDKLFNVLCKVPKLHSVRLKDIDCKNGRELVARGKHSFPVLRILKVVGFSSKLVFERGSMTKLETLVLFFYSERMSVVGLKNLESLKEAKLSGSKSNLEMERAVEQLRTHPNQVKLVVEYWD
ncbi:disease resistance protein Pik-2-like [Triticum aestivum]|uniref:disease resistance protein Pik-2-like n=1 Tax=Triticum aestivum TaxID=4565 RepID=UPI001D0279DB|nr:disease resistance protein Pik-2-like [Triticum aestivum]